MSEASGTTASLGSAAASSGAEGGSDHGGDATSDQRRNQQPQKRPGQQAPDPLRQTKHRVVTDGKEELLDYDEVIRRAQKGHAADERFRQASEKAKFAEILEEAVNSGDHKKLAQLKNLDPRKFQAVVENYLFEQYEQDERDRANPTEKELREERRRREEAEAKLSEADKKKADDAYFESLKSAGEEIDGEIGEALENLKRGKSPYVVKRMVDLMLASEETHGRRMPAKVAAQIAMKQLDSDNRDYLEEMSGLDVREAIKRLPPKLVKAIRDVQIEDAIGSRPRRGSASVTPAAQPAADSGESRTVDQAYKDLDKKYSIRRR
jgi:hypothetical protein